MHFNTLTQLGEGAWPSTGWWMSPDAPKTEPSELMALPHEARPYRTSVPIRPGLIVIPSVTPNRR